MDHARRILIVEDERIVALDLKLTLESLGYRVVGLAASAGAALALATSAGPDLVLMDVRLLGAIDGIEVAARLRAAMDVPVVFLTANADAETLARALGTAPDGFLAKPFNERTLHSTIEVALHRHDNQVKLRSDYDALMQESIVDPLTGLYNRRHLERVLIRELDFARRKQHRVGLILLDLDHFKRVNDEYGHQAGDAVLRGVADALRSRLRSYDIICRYGGEEIVIVVPGASLAETQKIAEDLRVGIAERSFQNVSEALRATASFGVAAYPENAKDPDGLVRAADAALYLAKASGRNRVGIASA